jgi:hypothetical protein
MYSRTVTRWTYQGEDGHARTDAIPLFQLNDFQDSQARLSVIGIKRNRTFVVSILHHLTARSYQFVP